MPEITESKEKVVMDMLEREGLMSVPRGLTFDPDSGYPTATVEKPIPNVEDLLSLLTNYGIRYDTLHEAYSARFSQRYATFDLFLDYLLDEYKLYNPTPGGVGITARSLSDIENDDSQIVAELLQVHGKVLIVGNGFSSLPLDLLNRNLNIEHIDVIDIFDPNVAIQQIEKICQAYKANDIALPIRLETALATLRQELARGDKITLMSVNLGVEQFYGKYDYVINIEGPDLGYRYYKRLLQNGGTLIDTYVGVQKNSE